MAGSPELERGLIEIGATIERARPHARIERQRTIGALDRVVERWHLLADRELASWIAYSRSLFAPIDGSAILRDRWLVHRSALPYADRELLAGASAIVDSSADQAMGTLGDENRRSTHDRIDRQRQRTIDRRRAGAGEIAPIAVAGSPQPFGGAESNALRDARQRMIKPRSADLSNRSTCQPLIETFVADQPDPHTGDYSIATIHRDPGLLEIADWSSAAKLALQPKTRIGLQCETGACVNSPAPSKRRAKTQKERKRDARRKDKLARALLAWEKANK